MKKFAFHAGLLLGLCVLTGVGLYVTSREPGGVEAVIRVRPLESENSEMYRLHKATYGQLLKSATVISGALLDKEVSSLSILAKRKTPVSFVQSRLVVSADETELILVGFDVAPWEASDEWVTLLDAILDSLKRRVIDRETLAAHGQLSRQREMASRLRNELVSKQDQLVLLSEKAGVGPRALGELQRSLSRLNGLEEMLITTKTRGLSAMAAGQDRSARNLDSAAKLLTQEIRNLENTIEYTDPSGELVARQTEIAAVKQGMIEMQQSIRQLDLKVQEPHRVSIVQDATRKLTESEESDYLTMDMQ